MIVTQTQEKIIEIYIGTFNRAPDASGLEYWVRHVEVDGWSVEDVAKSMFDSVEVAQTYPKTLSNAAFLDAVYQNVLGRNADATGLAYWLDEMDNGIQRSQMITTIINGAKADTGDAQDKQLLLNKTEAAAYFALELKLDDTQLAAEAMTVVSSDFASVQVSQDLQDLGKAQLDNVLNRVLGDDSKNNLIGTNVDDFLYGAAGDDTILATSGDNTVVAGNGTDTIQTGDGNDTVKGGNGDDTIYAGDGDDLLYGNSDDDSIHGDAGDDTIYGDDGEDYLYGDDGDDLLYGGDGEDNIFAGEGDDRVNAGAGDDSINAVDGNNFLDGDTGDDIIYGGLGEDLIYGGSGDDTIYGQEGNDIIDGLIDDDLIYGGVGDDILNGNEGDDEIYGGVGDDAIDAEEGNDTIYGGKGADTLVGGEGNDTFVFEALSSTLENLDTILDFSYSIAGIDSFSFEEKGTATIGETALDVSVATTLEEAATLATKEDGSSNTQINWFVFEDNTYVVQDNSSLNTFDGENDIIVKLQGAVSLDQFNINSIDFF